MVNCMWTLEAVLCHKGVLAATNRHRACGVAWRHVFNRHSEAHTQERRAMHTKTRNPIGNQRRHIAQGGRKPVYLTGRVTLYPTQ